MKPQAAIEYCGHVLRCITSVQWAHLDLNALMLMCSISVTALQDPYMNGPEFEYIWNTRPDLTGGLTQLNEQVRRVSAVLVSHLSLGAVVVAGWVAFA